MNRSLLLLIATAGLLLSAPAFAQSVTALQCGTTAQQLAGDPGTTVQVSCPANCSGHTIWGTGTYSDDSSVCVAAIHAGVLTSAGGQVMVTIAPGQSAYAPSAQNGVTSSSWGSWNRSFTLASASGGTIQLSCSQTAQSLAGDSGTTHSVQCPAGCTIATIWGTGVYSDDSAVCTAAVHAGVIASGAGGQFNVTIAPGQSEYPASTQHGVTSSRWGSWNRSFTVASP